MITFNPIGDDYSPAMIDAAVGFIPDMLSEHSQLSVAEQFEYTYAHGGGWSPFNGFEFHPEKKMLSYPGDPPMRAIAEAKLHDETILVFPYAWVLVLQLDGSWEVCRMD